MGLHYLLGLCLAVFSVSTLAALPSTAYDIDLINQRYSINNSSVTTPLNIRAFAANDPRVVSKGTAGLSQSAAGELVVSNKVKAPFTGSFNVSNPAFRQGAKTLFRRTAAGVVLTTGLEALLTSADWEFVDGEVVKPVDSGDPSNPDSWGSAPEGVTYRYGSTNYASINEAGQAAVDALPSSVCQGTVGSCSLVGFNQTGQSGICLQNLTNNCTILPIYTNGYGNTTSSLIGFVYANNPTGDISCSDGTYSSEYYGCVSASTGFEPVPESELDDLIDSSYVAEPEDWPLLFPYVEPDTFTVAPIPSVVLEPVTSTETDALTGEATVTVTDTSFDFAVNNAASPVPEIDVVENTSTKTYVNGSLVSDTSKSVSYPAVPSANNPSVPSPGGSGDGATSPTFEFPSFCSWATVICDWLDWTREPLDEDEPDLSAILTDEDFEQSYSFSFGTSSCPEPISINVAFLNKNIDLSYEPACDLAGYAKPFVLISAYIFAIYIGLGVVRNG